MIVLNRHTDRLIENMNERTGPYQTIADYRNMMLLKIENLFYAYDVEQINWKKGNIYLEWGNGKLKLELNVAESKIRTIYMYMKKQQNITY